MSTFKEYKNKINKIKELTTDLEKTLMELYEDAGGNIDLEEKNLLQVATDTLDNFIFVQESNMDTSEDTFTILKNDPFHFLDKEGIFNHKLFGIKSLLNPIITYTTMANIYMYEMDMLNNDTTKEIFNDIINLENQAKAIRDKIENEINIRDPYYVSDEELDEWEKSSN